MENLIWTFRYDLHLIGSLYGHPSILATALHFLSISHLDLFLPRFAPGRISFLLLAFDSGDAVFMLLKEQTGSQRQRQTQRRTKKSNHLTRSPKGFLRPEIRKNKQKQTKQPGNPLGSLRPELRKNKRKQTRKPTRVPQTGTKEKKRENEKTNKEAHKGLLGQN